jgi:hypothetical protein
MFPHEVSFITFCSPDVGETSPRSDVKWEMLPHLGVTSDTWNNNRPYPQPPAVHAITRCVHRPCPVTVMSLLQAPDNGNCMQLCRKLLLLAPSEWACCKFTQNMSIWYVLIWRIYQIHYNSYIFKKCNYICSLDHSGCVDQDVKCLRLLKCRVQVFESHLKHGCLHCLHLRRHEQVGTSLRDNPLPKLSCQLRIIIYFVHRPEL